MKKWFVLLMTLVMALPLCALADESRITVNGTVESDTTYQLIAPYSGVLTAFDWDNGDRVEKGETLFTMDTFKVYAPADGTVRHADDLTFTGTGRVLRCAVKEGDKVEKGQLLYELAGQDAQMDAQAALIAPADGALEVLTTSGQQVYRGQLLGKVHGLSAFHVVAQVDEVDLDRVHVGDSLAVELDRYPDTEVTGIVTEIAGLGVEKQNATYYDVTLSLSTMLELLPGMNATVRLN